MDGNELVDRIIAAVAKDIGDKVDAVLKKFADLSQAEQAHRQARDELDASRQDLANRQAQVATDRGRLVEEGRSWIASVSKHDSELKVRETRVEAREREVSRREAVCASQEACIASNNAKLTARLEELEAREKAHNEKVSRLSELLK